MVVAFEARQRLGRFNADVGASLGLLRGCWLSGRGASFDAGGGRACSSGVGSGPGAVEPETGRKMRSRATGFGKELI